MLKHQARWYVYELVDPRTDKAFYIGKGTGKRLEAHEKEAFGQVCSKKTSRIKEIWASGAEVQKRINAVFWDEQSAYDHETDMIAMVGLKNLTNVLPGGQKAWIERQQELSRRRAVKAERQLAEQMFTPQNERLLLLVASWFKFGGHKGLKLKASAGGNLGCMAAGVTMAFYNAFIPEMVSRVTKFADLRQKLAEAMKPHGVEVSYGCA
jgi:hypothetical protein